MAMGVLAFHTGMRDEPPKNASPQKRRLWGGMENKLPLRGLRGRLWGSRIWHHLSNGKFISCMNIRVSLSRILVERCLVPGLKV